MGKETLLETEAKVKPNMIIEGAVSRINKASDKEALLMSQGKELVKRFAIEKGMPIPTNANVAKEIAYKKLKVFSNDDRRCLQEDLKQHLGLTESILAQFYTAEQLRTLLKAGGTVMQNVADWVNKEISRRYIVALIERIQGLLSAGTSKSEIKKILEAEFGALAGAYTHRGYTPELGMNYFIDAYIKDKPKYDAQVKERQDMHAFVDELIASGLEYDEAVRMIKQKYGGSEGAKNSQFDKALSRLQSMYPSESWGQLLKKSLKSFEFIKIGSGDTLAEGDKIIIKHNGIDVMTGVVKSVDEGADLIKVETKFIGGDELGTMIHDFGYSELIQKMSAGDVIKDNEGRGATQQYEDCSECNGLGHDDVGDDCMHCHGEGCEPKYEEFEKKSKAGRVVKAKMGRFIYFVMQTQRASDGQYIALTCEENVRGYHLMDWKWGTDFAHAEATAQSMNDRMGISKEEAFKIQMSSMFPKRETLLDTEAKRVQVLVRNAGWATGEPAEVVVDASFAVWLESKQIKSEVEDIVRHNPALKLAENRPELERQVHDRLENMLFENVNDRFKAVREIDTKYDFDISKVEIGYIINEVVSTPEEEEEVTADVEIGMDKQAWFGKNPEQEVDVRAFFERAFNKKPEDDPSYFSEWESRWGKDPVRYMDSRVKAVYDEMVAEKKTTLLETEASVKIKVGDKVEILVNESDDDEQDPKWTAGEVTQVQEMDDGRGPYLNVATDDRVWMFRNRADRVRLIKPPESPSLLETEARHIGCDCLACRLNLGLKKKAEVQEAVSGKLNELSVGDEFVFLSDPQEIFIMLDKNDEGFILSDATTGKQVMVDVGAGEKQIAWTGEKKAPQENKQQPQQEQPQQEQQKGEVDVSMDLSALKKGDSFVIKGEEKVMTIVGVYPEYDFILWMDSSHSPKISEFSIVKDIPVEQVGSYPLDRIDELAKKFKPFLMKNVEIKLEGTEEEGDSKKGGD